MRSLVAIASAAVGLSACGNGETVVVGRAALDAAVPSAGAGGGAAQPGSGGSAGISGSTAPGGSAGTAGVGGVPNCDPPLPLHRYAFDGVGTTITDSIAGWDGVALGGATLDGSGVLTLDGVTGYVDLPDRLVSGRAAVTLVAWVRRVGGPAYVRVFDFGTGSDGEDPAEGLGTIGLTYLALTPATGYFPAGLAALLSKSGAPGEVVVATDTTLDTNLHCIEVAVASGTTLALTVDGTLLGRVPTTIQLSEIDDVNDWLGRSQYDQDPYFWGAYAEFRVYDGAFDSCTARAVYDLGPDRVSR